MIWLGCYKYQEKQKFYSDLESFVLTDCKRWCNENMGKTVYAMSPWDYLTLAQERLISIGSYFTYHEQIAIYDLLE